ncbi:anaphase-promoting complex subunit 4-like [Zingiber officinale]|uniref:anaphase-promoting complex subunit 4-like n=1 Tax=Zingiber officinale TaxID=94328 RepID=UPI001C4AFEF0|nr:anaphase-promoting complex subunit 4-like [Zingiber officinale]
MAAEVEEEEVEMESTDAASGRPIPFQLQLDKPLPFQISIAEWNPEKDLLAMVTDDSKVVLHRFNWQRLWMISPGKCITSLCWRPDGKVIALGIEDGSILLHDVENGKLLRSIKSHSVAVIYLNWEEDSHAAMEDVDNAFVYEDRTSRFFPPAPRIPRMPGLGAGDAGLMDDYEDTFHEFSTSPGQHFNVLSSGDKDGSICFSIFGIFPIGKINIHQLPIRATLPNRIATLQILNASIQKLALSKNLSQLIVLCFGELVEDFVESKSKSIQRVEHFELQSSSVNRVSSVGLHCFVLKTSIFLDRKNELHQVAQQASSIEDLVEVVRASLSVMSKHWSEAMHSFHEKFDPLSSLIVDHGLFSTPQDEFLSVLFGARTSPPLHQFLANTLGEAGLKRVSKAVDCAGKELHSVIHEHLQPAVEIIGFRIAELRGLSRWRARYRVIGLDEKLIDNATKKAGMLLVQVERFSRILVIVLHLLQNFFNWVLRSIKILMSEPIDQVQSANSELIVVFLKFVLNHDPVGELMDATKTIDVDGEIMERLEELVIFGGYADTKYLERNLLNEFNQMEQCFKEAFLHQFTTVSQKIHCEGLMPLYEFRYSTQFSSPAAPTSIVYYKGNYGSESTNLNNLIDYTCFKVPNESLELTNCIGIMRGFTNAVNPLQKQTHCPEAVLLRVPEAFHCVDLSFYKENQLILLLNEATSTSDSAMRSLIMMVQLDDLCFLPLSREVPEIWAIHCLKASAVDMHLENGKVRYVPDPVSRPLAVSASRGLACVFTSRSHAMVYILDEDEDEDEASGA